MAYTRMDEIDQLTMRQLPDYLYHIAYRRNRPVMLWGIMGVGKSDGVRQFAARIAGMVVDFRAGLRESIDLRGLPIADLATRTTEWLMPGELPFVGNDRFPDDIPIILFLDEVNGGTRSVAGSLYQLFLDRCVGEHVLKDNVIMIAAGNRESDRGVTERQPAPLSNRLNHVEIVPAVEPLQDYIIAEKLPMQAVAFLSWQPDMICTFDPSKNLKAFASPRSIICGLHDLHDDLSIPEDIRWTAMAGWVGRGWADTYKGFLKVYDDMKDIMPEIMRNPGMAPIPRQPDQCYAVATNIGGQMTLKNVALLDQYLRRMNPEFDILGWKLAMKLDDEIDQSPEFAQYSKRHRAILQGI